jgi:hypothetical protein
VQEAAEVDGGDFGAAAGLFDRVDVGDDVVQSVGRARLGIGQLDQEGNNGDFGRVVWKGGRGGLADGCRERRRRGSCCHLLLGGRSAPRRGSTRR